MEEHTTPRLCSPFLGILHICPQFLLHLPILSNAEGYSCPCRQDSRDCTESMGGAHLSDQSFLGVRRTKLIPVPRTVIPRSPSPAQHPHPKGMQSGPLGRYLNFPLPYCLFCSMGSIHLSPVFRTCLPLRTCSRTAQSLDNFGRIPISWHGSLP